MLLLNDIANHAFLIACEAHKGQFRADKKTPYIEHPKEVARIFLKNYYDGGYRMLSFDDEGNGVAVAYLHDAVEDGGITFSELEKHMPPPLLMRLSS